MKMYKLLALVLAAALLLSLAACGKRESPVVTTAPTTEPIGTTAPPETTVPPTTEEPHIELTPDDIVELLYDAGKMYDAGETIVLKYHWLADYYASGSRLAHLGIVDVVQGETITVCCASENAKEDGVKERVQFLCAMSWVTETHPDCYYSKKYSDSYIFSVFCDFETVGCKTIEEYTALNYEKIESGNFNYEYDGKTEFTFDIKNGFVCYSVVKIVDDSHIFTDVVDIFEISDIESQTTLYEEYVKAKGEG